MQRAREAADNLASVSARLDVMISDNRRDLRAFTRDGLPELQGLIRDGRDAANEFRDLSRSLRENPSQLIYRPPPQGVEIPR